MNQVLYWTDRTTDPNGWFYKTQHDWEEELCFSYYQVQRVIYGDERVQSPKRNLSEVGLETKVKMAPNGRNATFYRLDVPQFVGMFVAWLEEKFGDIANRIKNMMSPSSSQPRDTRPAEPSFSPASSSAGDESLFLARNEQTPTPTERVNLPWENAYNGASQTIAYAWTSAQTQLEIEFDRATYNMYFQNLVLVDYAPESHTFTLAVSYINQLEMLNHRLHRSVERTLSSVFRQEVALVFITYDEWNDRHR